MDSILDTYKDSTKDLEGWIERNGWEGYDPYDIKSHPYVLRISNKATFSFFYTIFREFLFEVFNTFPNSSRRILKIKKSINPKALSLFALSYLNLYRLTADEKYQRSVQEVLDWLAKNRAETSHGHGWGYPFNWQSVGLIPVNTPNGIVTTVVGEAFWRYYKDFNSDDHLKVCDEVCKFLVSLPYDQVDTNKICFSYTPVYKNHVHNLNLFIAEFLIKVGRETNNKEYTHLGNCALNYTLSDQREDGSFDYNGPPEKPNNFVDNYHTGFVLRMLHSSWKLTGREDVYQALERCYTHYTANFFEDNRIPKLMPNRKYRIDIHSCAESVNCLSELSETFPQGLVLAEHILDWTILNLQDSKGYFYYGILKSRFTGLPFKSKIAYLRWGQAWMFKALTSFMLAKRNTL
jgi:hypothetical protein